MHKSFFGTGFAVCKQNITPLGIHCIIMLILVSYFIRPTVLKAYNKTYRPYRARTLLRFTIISSLDRAADTRRECDRVTIMAKTFYRPFVFLPATIKLAPIGIIVTDIITFATLFSSPIGMDVRQQTRLRRVIINNRIRDE